MRLMRCSTPGPPLGILVKSSLPKFFLFLKAKGTVVGGDDLQVIALESVPEFFLVPFFAKRRSEDVLRAFEAGRVHIFEREIQILRASFGVDGKAAIACFANFFQRFVAAEMHDVDRERPPFPPGRWRGTWLRPRRWWDE